MRRALWTLGALGVLTLHASSCAFEACCMRPCTGAYDVCFSAAAPRALEPAPAPRPEALRVTSTGTPASTTTDGSAPALKW